MKKDYRAIKSKVMKIKSYETATGHFRESFVLCARFRGNIMSEMDLKAQMFLHVSFGKWYLTFVFVFNVLSLLSR